MTTCLHELLRGTKVSSFGGDLRKLKNWLASIGKGQLIYIALAKDSQRVFEKARGKGAQAQSKVDREWGKTFPAQCR